MSEHNRNPSTKTLYPLLFGLVLAAGIGVGVLLSTKPGEKPIFFSGGHVTELEEILRYIDAQYVDSVSMDELRGVAIRQMFNHLDPHSFYIHAEELKQTNEQLEGRLEGIGIEFNIVKDTIIIVAPLPGGPSEQAGLLSGDRIVKINDTVVAGTGITNRLVQKKLKGPKGTKVTVTVMRAHSDQLFDYTLERDRIQIYSIVAAHMMDRETGYIKISQFTQSTHHEFVAAVKRLKSDGMTRLMIDVRDNGGGYLEAATSIADELIDGSKLLVYTEGRHSPRENKRAGRNGVFEDGPVVLMINEGSASASEILAGAIQDWERGIVAGRRSYGKGLVQRQINLRDGGAIRLTTARYYTPKGRSLQRPYDNGVDAYFEDYLNRIVEEAQHHDSVGALDSADWGVFPDLLISIDTSRDLVLVRRLMATGILQDFCYQYATDHRESLARFTNMDAFDSGFKVSRELLTSLAAYVTGQSADFTAPEVTTAGVYVHAVIRALLAKQIFYLDGYYKMLNHADSEVQAAYRALLDKRNLISSERTAGREHR